MWIQALICIWWIVCILSTYCILQGTTLLSLIRKTVHTLISYMLPTSMTKLAPVQQVLSLGGVRNQWPPWRQILYSKHKHVMQEVLDHYYNCNQNCLCMNSFETSISSHYSYIHFLSTTLGTPFIGKMSYLYIPPKSSYYDSDCHAQTYELNLISEPFATKDRVLHAKDQKIYHNSADYPLVVLRIYLENESSTDRITKPVSHFVHQISNWSSQ